VGSFPVDAQPHNPRGGGLAEAVAHVRGLAGERGAARRQADRTAGVAAHLGRTQHRHHVVAVGVATGGGDAVDAEQLLRISMSPTLVKLVILFLTSP
jgi:hypothetical protein